MNRKGFTLLELLVVVLIIGILASVALPQYRVAVKKATLSKYMDLVKSLKAAEEIYFMAEGQFTTDLDSLHIDLPKNDSCTKTTASTKAFYKCGDETWGVWGGPTNAQAGDKTIRYVQFFDSGEVSAGSFLKDDIVCYSKGAIARKACKLIGNGEERVASGDWHYVYVVR